MAAKKTARARVVVRNGDAPTSNDFAISARVLWWVGGGIAAVLVAVVSWFTIWDRIDTHWRLETIQSSKDKEVDAKVQAVRDKAEQDTKQLAKKAEIGRGWLFWTIADAKAFNATQWSRFCKPMKLSPDICEQLASDAKQYRDEASKAKSDATEAGKDK